MVLVSLATGVQTCKRKCGSPDLCWGKRARERGGGGVRPFLYQPKMVTLSNIGFSLEPTFDDVF